MHCGDMFVLKGKTNKQKKANKCNTKQARNFLKVTLFTDPFIYIILKYLPILYILRHNIDP